MASHSCSVMILSQPSLLHQCFFPVNTDFISSLQHSCPIFPLLPVLLSVCAGDLLSLMSKLLGHSKDIAHSHKYNPRLMQRAQAELMAQIDNLMQKADLGSPRATLAFQTREDPVLVRDRVHKFHQLETTAKSPGSKLLATGQGGSWRVWGGSCCFLSLVLRTFFLLRGSVCILHSARIFGHPLNLCVHVQCRCID